MIPTNGKMDIKKYTNILKCGKKYTNIFKNIQIYFCIWWGVWVWSVVCALCSGVHMWCDMFGAVVGVWCVASYIVVLCRMLRRMLRGCVPTCQHVIMYVCVHAFVCVFIRTFNHAFIQAHIQT